MGTAHRAALIAIGSIDGFAAVQTFCLGQISGVIVGGRFRRGNWIAFLLDVGTVGDRLRPAHIAAVGQQPTEKLLQAYTPPTEGRLERDTTSPR